MNAPGERVLPIGYGSFDPLTGELCIDECRAKLRPRTAAVLAHLVRSGDRVVSKDELMQAVWPDVVVTDDSLVQCIKEIRQALRDTGQDWIRTVPRQGYAFVGSGLAAPAVGPAAAAQRWPRAAAAALAVLVATALLGWRLWPVAFEHPPVIVLLPIVNTTGDAARESAAEDLTESLTTALARVPGIMVIAPSTAFTFKGKVVDVRRIGAELGVRYVLEGSLRATPAKQESLRLRLVETASALQLWSDEFASESEFDVLRDEVTARVARSLSLRLARIEAQRSQHLQPRDASAADLLAQARSTLRWAAQDADAGLKARPLLEQSLQRDERQSEAWALLARTYLYNVRFSGTPEQDLRRAADAAARALALEPDSAEAHGVQSWVLYNERRMPQALAEFDRALELNPNEPSMLAGRGASLIMLGRPEEALVAIEKAIRLSPRDPLLAQWQMFHGVADLHLGREEAAVDWLTRAVDGNPRDVFARLFLASALGAAGRVDKAQHEMVQFQGLRPGFTLRDFIGREPSNAVPFRRQREHVYAGLRMAGMPE